MFFLAVITLVLGVQVERPEGGERERESGSEGEEERDASGVDY